MQTSVAVIEENWKCSKTHPFRFLSSGLKCVRGGWDLERWQGTSSVKAATITDSSLMCDMLKQVYVNGHLFCRCVWVQEQWKVTIYYRCEWKMRETISDRNTCVFQMPPWIRWLKITWWNWKHLPQKMNSWVKNTMAALFFWDWIKWVDIPKRAKQRARKQSEGKPSGRWQIGIAWTVTLSFFSAIFECACVPASLQLFFIKEYNKHNFFLWHSLPD